MVRTRDFRADDEVFALVEAFETGAIAPSEFSHAAHIAVGLAYLAESPPAEATDRMRDALGNFMRHHALTGYHETLTVFWIRLLAHLAATRYRALPLWERINRAVASHGSKRPVEAHFSPALVASPEARARWVEPDVLPLPF
jgi:hypothetical protein